MTIKPQAIIQIIDVLKTYLPHDLYALDFTKTHYNTLLNKLNISNDEHLFDLKRGIITEAIIDYFGLSFQRVSVEITLHNCSITKHFVDTTGSEKFDRLLYTNSKHLIDIATQKETFKVLPFLLLVPEEIKNSLFKFFLDKNISLLKARMLIRGQVQSIFDLDEKDLIFFLRGRMWIRYFTPPKKLPDGKDKRFAGESVEVLEALFLAYFPNGMWKDIESILGEVLDEKLNFSIIDNTTFTKTFIPVFRGMIEILLIDVITPVDQDKIEGFTGYVLRQYFDQILLYTAKNLLSFIENRDKNAELFIKNFSDNVLIDTDGKRIKRYPIVDSKQHTWNHVTILSILMQYKQVKLRMISQNNIITGIKEQLTQSNKNLLSEKNNEKLQEVKINKIIKELAESDLINFKNKKNSDFSHQKRHEELLSMRKAEDNELYFIKNHIANITIDLTREQKKLIHETEARIMINEQIEPLKETYERIANALVLVLAKR